MARVAGIDGPISETTLTTDGSETLRAFLLETKSIKDMIPKPWRAVLHRRAFDDHDMLEESLRDDLRRGHSVYPHIDHWFRALSFFNPENTRVVWVGQDPYHSQHPDDPTRGVADGLAFSISSTSRSQPSINNIFKEAGIDPASRGSLPYDLSGLAEQGVLLLNRVLTVRKGKANSHKSYGWRDLTAEIISAVSKAAPHVVFMLWGKPAQEVKCEIANQSQHLILEAPHPSPLSAHLGFTGCGHFAAADAFFAEHKLPLIDWSK